MADISGLDLYALLEIADDAGEKEIKTAYRKKALKCHPDKNPDNPSAIDLFHRLSKALEVLTDVKARDAYDRILKARKATEVRNRQLDSKRKKLKEDLESRERDAELRAAAQNAERPEYAAKKLQAEIERLRREGSKQLSEEIELMKQQIKEEMDRVKTAVKAEADDSSSFPRIKVQWKKQKGVAAPYDHDSLTSLFNKYGEVSCLVLSKCRAIVEFKVVSLPEEVVNEVGSPEFPLRVTWVTPPQQQTTSSVTPDRSPFVLTGVDGDDGYRDYESLVLMRLRQAEERKRLAAQIKRDEDGEEVP